MRLGVGVGVVMVIGVRMSKGNVCVVWRVRGVDIVVILVVVVVVE